MERRAFDLSAAHRKSYRDTAFKEFLSAVDLIRLQIGIRHLVFENIGDENRTPETWFVDAVKPILVFLAFCDALLTLEAVKRSKEGKEDPILTGAFLNFQSNCRMQELEIGLRNLIIAYVSPVDKAADQWFFDSLPALRVTFEFIDSLVSLNWYESYGII